MFKAFYKNMGADNLNDLTDSVVSAFANAGPAGARVAGLMGAASAMLCRTDQMIVYVQSKRLLEGNWIVYLSDRCPGTDDLTHHKMTVTKKDGRWVVAYVADGTLAEPPR